MVGMNLATLRDMAQWRLDNLDWLEKPRRTSIHSSTRKLLAATFNPPS
jgi:hypothetical protein